MAEGKYPLEGLRVLDLSRVLAGPVCCQLLADLGADVVKVERPGVGDDTRHWGPPFVDGDGPSAYYLSANRGKRSVALDLAHGLSGGVLADLIRTADVLVENFRPAALRKFGLESDHLRKLNPQLVVCSISGYGRTGPMADVPGYDLVIQATSGLMSITGETDGAPMKVGVAITDVVTGLYAAVSALAGLYARGKGRPAVTFDLALADCALASLVNVVQSTLVTGHSAARYGNAHPSIVPYEVFATGDGHLVLAVGNDSQWQRLCHALDRDPWAVDPRFRTNPLRVTNREALIPLIQETFATRTMNQWCEVLDAADVPHAPVLTLDEALKQPQVAAREMVHHVTDAAGRTYQLLDGAVHWDGEPPRSGQAPPLLGEHTDEVLDEWLGYDRVRIAELRKSGAIE